MNIVRQKLYEYVDESGRNPNSPAFVVGIVITNDKRHELERRLLRHETDSGKRLNKWKKTHPAIRKRYVAALQSEPLLKNALYAATFPNDKQYFDHTAVAIIQSLRGRKEDTLVYIDGLRLTELNKVRRLVRPSVKNRVILKSLKREESSAIMRLADAVCGLVRNVACGNEWAINEVKKLKRKGLLTAE